MSGLQVATEAEPPQSGLEKETGSGSQPRGEREGEGRLAHSGRRDRRKGRYTVL